MEWMFDPSRLAWWDERITTPTKILIVRQPEWCCIIVEWSYNLPSVNMCDVYSRIWMCPAFRELIRPEREVEVNEEIGLAERLWRQRVHMFTRVEHASRQMICSNNMFDGDILLLVRVILININVIIVVSIIVLIIIIITRCIVRRRERFSIKSTSFRQIIPMHHPLRW